MGNLPFEKIKRKVIVKKEASTNSNFGKKPEERTIEELIKYGVINLNKSPGPTSHQIVDYVKKIFGIKKAGHSGTLDPNVTGVLPIAFEMATRVVQILLNVGKEYVCLMHLHKKVPQSEIHKTIEKFVGEIRQMPPIKSAVKREERGRKVYYIEVLEIEGQEVLFRVGCEAGTYIRKLVHDFGKVLGCGAHMAQLVRTKAGPFKYDNSFTLHDIKDAYEFWKEGSGEEIKKIILPFEKAVEHLGKIWIVDGAVDPVCHGSDLYVAGVSKFNDKIKIGDIVAVFTLKNELVCIGKAGIGSESLLKENKGIAVTETKVFMERGTYVERKN